MAKKMQISMTVNGESHDLLAEPRELLIHVLREKLGLTGRISAAKPAIAAPARSTWTENP